jgi:arginyl-tRNA synthetase
VFRKLGKDFSQVEGRIVLDAPHEQDLAAKLAQFGEVLNSVGEKGTPHILCTYLYEVAGLFSSFYENCPILTADDEAQKQSRLRLAALAGRTLKQGLELLGLPRKNLHPSAARAATRPRRRSRSRAGCGWLSASRSVRLWCF